MDELGDDDVFEIDDQLMFRKPPKERWTNQYLRECSQKCEDFFNLNLFDKSEVFARSMVDIGIEGNLDKALVCELAYIAVKSMDKTDRERAEIYAEQILNNPFFA